MNLKAALAITLVFAATAGLAILLGEPLVACLLLVPVLLLAIPELPVFWIAVALLAARALVDSSGSGGALTAPTALIAGSLTFLGLGVLLRGGRWSLVLALTAVVVTISASFAISAYGGEVTKELLRVLSVLAVIAICLHEGSRVGPDSFARGVQLIALGPALVAVLQNATGTGVVINSDMRATGTIAHPNSAALLFALALVTSLYRRKSHESPRLDLVFTAIFAVALVGTRSIGGLAAGAAMVLVWYLVQPGVSAFRRWLGILLVLGLLATIAQSAMIATRLGGLWGDGEQGTAAESFGWRLAAWETLQGRISEAPWFGLGYGATTSGEIVMGSIPHNEYLRLAVEVGVIGLLAIAIVVVVLLKPSIAAARRGSPSGALVIAVVVGLAVSAVGANTFLYPVATYVAAIILFGIGAPGVRAPSGRQVRTHSRYRRPGARATDSELGVEA